MAKASTVVQHQLLGRDPPNLLLVRDFNPFAARDVFEIHLAIELPADKVAAVKGALENKDETLLKNQLKELVRHRASHRLIDAVTFDLGVEGD